MKTYLNGKYQPQKSINRPGYMALYEREQRQNKFLVFFSITSLFLGIIYALACHRTISNQKAELEALNRLRTEELTRTVAIVDQYNQLLMSNPLSTDPKEIIRAVFREDSERAIAIAKCESGLNPKAYNKNKNGSTDHGLFQVNSVHKIPAQYLNNPVINVLVAKQIFDRQGWNPWVCSRKI